MALINCPNCNHPDISDTAVSCPHCKYNVKLHFEHEKQQKELEAQKESIKYITCPECYNNHVPENETFCPQCGYNIDSYLRQLKVEAEKDNKKSDIEAHTALALIAVVIHLFCLIIGYLFTSSFGILLIILASIFFVSFMTSNDYAIYQDKWFIYGIVMCLFSFLNAAIGAWIIACIYICCWRAADAQRWMPK